MLKRMILLLALSVISLDLSGGKITLDNAIVLPANPTAVEEFAVKELADFLQQATGSTCRIIRENAWNGEGNVIFCGRTEHAKKIFPEFRKLKSEEWLITTSSGRHLIITGGKPRGTLYGVYEFLEKYVGCRFLAINADYIPKLASVQVPENISEQGKPFFPYRMMSFGVQSDDCFRFHVRNRIQGPAKGIPPEWGGWYMFGAPNRCHTFGIYSQNLPKERLDLFSLNARGERLVARDGVGPGQLCLSNLETRRLMKNLLRDFIRQDRERAGREGVSYPVIYDISQNDNHDYCLCAGCRDLEKKYGNQTGVLLDFINDIAADIAEDYPDVLIQTFAYAYTEEIPKGIVPRENVLMQLAFLGREFHQYRDTMRSIHHPNNARTKKAFRDWAGISPQLATWDYGKIWVERFPTPYTFVRGQEENLRFYAENKVRAIYLETELWGPGLGPRMTEIQSFCDLKNYHFARLMMNPYADSEAIIDDFMKHYYGPAAGAMKDWLNYLEARMKDESGYIGGDIIAKRRYLDRKFFLTTEDMLSKAEKSVAGDKKLLKRVQQERFMVDYCLLNLWDKLFSDVPFSRKKEEVLARLEKIQNQVRKRYFEQNGKIIDPNLKMIPEEDAKRFAAFFHPEVPLPAEFADKSVVMDFPWTKLREGMHCKLVDDPGAMGGKAMRLGDISAFENPHGKPFELGIYDNDAKKIIIQKNIPKDKLPRDEKYHWMALKNVVLTPKCRMWSHWTWGLSPAPVNDAFSSAAPFKKYDIFFSVKFEGPAYVPHSLKRNAILMDRVIVVNTDMD